MQVRMDFLTEIATYLFILAAIILGDKGLISLGALALVINSGITVYWAILILH